MRCRRCERIKLKFKFVYHEARTLIPVLWPLGTNFTVSIVSSVSNHFWHRAKTRYLLTSTAKRRWSNPDVDTLSHGPDRCTKKFPSGALFEISSESYGKDNHFPSLDAWASKGSGNLKPPSSHWIKRHCQSPKTLLPLMGMYLILIRSAESFNQSILFSSKRDLRKTVPWLLDDATARWHQNIKYNLI